MSQQPTRLDQVLSGIISAPGAPPQPGPSFVSPTPSPRRRPFEIPLTAQPIGDEFTTPFAQSTAFRRFGTRRRSTLPVQDQVPLQGLTTPESMKESIDTKQTLLGRIGENLYGVAEWVQRNVDAPIPGIISAAFSASTRTDVSAVEAIGSSLDFLFTGSNSVIERELRKIGVELPNLDGHVGADMLRIWQAYGDFQMARPDAFWGEKFLEELLFSPANFIPFGKASRALGMANAIPRAGRALAWNQSKFNPFQLTRRGRKAVSERYFQENMGMTFAAIDPKTGRSVDDFTKGGQLFEARNRISSFWEGGDDIKSLWGDQWNNFETQRTHNALRKAFATREDLDIFLDEDLPDDLLGILHVTQRKIANAELGGMAVGKPNAIMRGQQKIKNEMSPALLGATLRYPIYNMMTNMATLFFRHGARVGKIGESGDFAQRLGVIDPAGTGRAGITLSETGGFLREFTVEAGAQAGEWRPFLTRIPVLGNIPKWGMKLATMGDDYARKSDFNLTAMKTFRHGWKKELDMHELPDDVRSFLGSAVSPEELESRLVRLMQTEEAFTPPVVRPGEAAGPEAFAPMTPLDLANTGDLPEIARAYWDDTAINMGSTTPGPTELRIIAAQAKQRTRSHYRDVSDESTIEFGSPLEAGGIEYERLIDDLEEGSRVATEPRIKDAFQKEADRLRADKLSFSRDLELDNIRVLEANARSAEAVGITDVLAYGQMKEQLKEIRVLQLLRDRRQVERFYRDIISVDPLEAETKIFDLRKAHTEARIKIRKEFTDRLVEHEDAWTKAINNLPESQRSGVSIDSLNLPTRMESRTLRRIMDEKGLDPKIYDPDQPPDIAAFIKQQRDKELSAIDRMVSDADELWRRTQLVDVTPGRLTPDDATGIRAGYNKVRAQAQRIASETTQQDFFDYGWRNYSDYAQNHLMPYPFWATRYMMHWITRTVQNPNQARVMMETVKHFVDASDDEPPHLRFSTKVATLSDDSEVRISPFGGILPIATPFINLLNPGRESNDLVTGMAQMQDFMGGFFFPTTELLLSASQLVPDIAGVDPDVTRTGGRGLARNAKEISLDLIPQLAMIMTGVNALGFEGITAAAGDMLINESDKNSIMFAIGDDLTTGVLTDPVAAREAIESIRKGKPNGLAAIYAKKALGRRALTRASGLMGMPIRISTPGERKTAEGRRLLLPEDGSFPPAPDEVDSIYKQYPGLEITQGETIPSGLSRLQADQYRVTSGYWRTVRDLQSERDEELAAAWERLLDPGNPLRGTEYRDQRSTMWASYIDRVRGALDGTVEQAELRGLDPGGLPLPLAQDAEGRWIPDAMNSSLSRLKRQEFWSGVGRIVYPDNPLRFVEDGYYGISASDFVDEETQEIVWSDFFAARQEYMDTLPDPEYNYLRARIESRDNKDRGFRIAQEAARPYWQLRESLLARNPRVEMLLREIELALKRGDNRRAARLRRRSTLRRFNTRLAREQERLRRRNPRVDAALVTFWDLVPQRRNSAALGRQLFLSE